MDNIRNAIREYLAAHCVVFRLFWTIVRQVSLLPFDSDRPCSGQAHFDWRVANVVIHFMKANLLTAASAVIPNQQILVNMVSRRVRQLCLGHRPLVEFVPGLGRADVALTEIANKKLTYESTFGQNGTSRARGSGAIPGNHLSSNKARKRRSGGEASRCA